MLLVVGGMVGEPVAGVLVGGRRDRVQVLDDRVQALGDRVQALDDRVQALDDRVQALGDRVQALDDRVFFSLVEVLDFSLNDLCFPLEGPRLSSLLLS